MRYSNLIYVCHNLLFIPPCHWRSVAPRIAARPAQARADHGDVDAHEQSAKSVEWVDMYEESGVFGSATFAIFVAGLMCSSAIYGVFSLLQHEVVSGENGGVGAE